MDTALLLVSFVANQKVQSAIDRPGARMSRLFFLLRSNLGSHETNYLA